MSFNPKWQVLLALGWLFSVQAPGWAQQAAPKPAAPAAKHPATTKPASKPLNLNTATRAELMKLPGINGKVADKILAQRPFLTKSKLVTEKVITMGLYQSIKDRVFVQVTNEDARKANAKQAIPAPAKP